MQQKPIISLASSNHDVPIIFSLDVAFFRRKQMRTELGLEEEAMRDYFPLPTVLEGIFGLIKQQFGLELSLVTPEEGAGSGPLGSLWHPDCQLYKVVDTDNSETLGHCYLDPYIRDDKAYQVRGAVNFRD